MRKRPVIEISKGFFGYVRVSTEGQADFGVSLEAQESKIRAMATVQGAELVEVVVDGGESAKSLNRPGLQRLMELINTGKVQGVIVAKLDRLTRSVKDLCGLLELFEKRKVALISVAEALDTSSAAGRMVIQIMGVVSQFEREAIGERTRDALQFKKRERRVYSGDPYGYARDGGNLVPVPDEQTVVVRIKSMHAGGATLRAIAAALNAEGVPTKLGRAWAPQTAKNIIVNTIHKAA